MSFKVLHLSKRDSGGAGIAALRLHKAMLQCGKTSRFLCLDKSTSEKHVIQYPKFYPRFYHRILDKMGFAITQQQKNDKKLQQIKAWGQPELYSFLRSDYHIHTHELFQWADIIIIHWIAGFLDFKTFFKHIPKDKSVFWYAHDFSILLGGFHTLFDDQRFKETKYKALEIQLKKQKQTYVKSFQKLNLIGNSKFTYQTLLDAKVFNDKRIHCVPLGIPKNELTKIDKSIAKQALGFNSDSFIVINSSTSISTPRKGADRLIPILENTSKQVERLNVMTLGAHSPELETNQINFHAMGSIWHPQFKSIIFSAADVVVSSAYEETFGQTIIEAYACGTPAIVFNNAALPELINDEETGYIAKTNEEFSQKLIDMANGKKMTAEMGNKAYELFLKKYTSGTQVERLWEVLEKTII